MKKRTIITTTDNHSNDNQEEKNRNDMQKYKPHYVQVSGEKFKQILSNTIPDGDKIVQCLNTKEKLRIIRQITGITTDLQYFDLQRHLWQDYYDLGMKEGKWTSQVSESYAKQHHTCLTYGFPKHIVEQRQQTIQYQLQRTRNELQQCIIELEQNSKQWQPSLDSNLVLNAINECVKNGLQRFRQAFDYRRKAFSAIPGGIKNVKHDETVAISILLISNREMSLILDRKDQIIESIDENPNLCFYY
jgi:hypothetical protein